MSGLAGRFQVPAFSIQTDTQHGVPVDARRSGQPRGGDLHRDGALLASSVGRGPVQARTTIGPDLVARVTGATLTKGEQTLVAGDEAEVVLDRRRAHQRIIRTAAIDAVQTITGRSVLAFMSCNHINPDLAVEVFVLRPLAPQARPDDHVR